MTSQPIVWNGESGVRGRREVDVLLPHEDNPPVYGEVKDVEVERPAEVHLAEAHRYREA